MHGDAVKWEGEGWVMLRGTKRWASASEAARAILLLSAVGMPWERKRHGYEDWFGWNGKALRLNEPIGDILHEMAHWVIAPPEWRACADFGLESRTGNVAYGEEGKASLFGILLERAMDLPWGDTYREHNWSESPRTRRAIVEDMRRLGLLRDMTPTCLRPLPRLPSSSGGDK